MQVQLLRANPDARHLDEIVNAFTPPMLRVCRHMAGAALGEMIERMAIQQLADEQRRRAEPRHRSRIRRTQTSRAFCTLHRC